MRIRSIILGLTLVMCLSALPVLAQNVNCSTATPLPTDGIPLTFAIGTAGGSAIPGTPFCGGLGHANNVDIFEITLLSTQKLRITYSAAFNGVLGMGLFGSCDETDCINSIASPFNNAVMNTCLPAGTYYLILNDMTDLYYSYSVSAVTSFCDDPVIDNDAPAWGMIKTLYR